MQKDRKKAHKKIIKYMRNANKQIAEDAYVGLNRFRIDLFSENMYRFEDGSGVQLFLIFKMTDNLTGNTAYFHCDNYNYIQKIYEYLNDFLIRCSSGHSGHWPHLHYIAYDVHAFVEYAGRRNLKPRYPEDGVIQTYDLTHYDLYGGNNE